MKKLVRITVLIICVMSLSLLSGCTNKTGRVVNVLNWSSYIPDSVIRDFEKETGIEVNYSTYSSNEECLAKVSSAKEGTYDLIFPSDYMIEIMTNRKMLEPMHWNELENIDNLDPFYLNHHADCLYPVRMILFYRKKIQRLYQVFFQVYLSDLLQMHS